MYTTYFIYNFTLLSVLGASYCVSKSKNNRSEFLFRFLVFFILVLPASIRHGIGTDFWNYVDLYNSYRHGFDDHEIGFQLLGIILNKLDCHYQFFIITLSILTFFPVCFYVPKKNYFPFIFFYFLINYLNVISTGRQPIANAFAIGALFSLYKERGTIKFIILIIFAFSFHYSSILYFPLLLLKRIELKARYVYLIFISIFIFNSANSVIQFIFNNQLFLNSSYGTYATNSFNREAEINSGLGVLANLLVPIVFILKHNQLKKDFKHINILVFITLIYIFATVLSTKVHIFGRFLSAYNFAPALIVHLASFSLSKRHYKFILLAFMCIYVILFEKNIFANNIMLGEGLGVSPFITIFD